MKRVDTRSTGGVAASLADAERAGLDDIEAWDDADDAALVGDEPGDDTGDGVASDEPWAATGGNKAAPVFDREEELALVMAAQRGDTAARDQLVRASRRHIVWIARRYRGSGVPLDDLVSEGSIGVLTAIDRFDPARGTRFETYSRWWILDALRNCVLQQSRTVRLPANVVREIGSIERLMKRAEGDPAGAAPDRSRSSVIDRVAQQLRRSGHQVEELLALREPTLPMESIAERAHDDSIGAAPEHASPWSPESIAAMNQILRHLGELMNEGLSERERLVLTARYGLETGVPASLEELGARLGLTAERVRQVQGEATAKLRAKFVERRLLPGGSGAPRPARTRKQGTA